MSQHGDDAYRPADRVAERDRSSRLLRAIEELRALDREKHSAPPASQPFRELTRRLEMKAREVFEIAADEPDDPVDADDEAAPRLPRH